MRLTWLLLAVVSIAFAKEPEQQVNPTPILRVVEPYSVKPGAEVVTTGENLSAQIVAAVYLTTSNTNIPVTVSSQDDKTIRFKVPADVKPGKYSISVLLRREPTLLEEPVRLIVE
jgi:hypothetical protein